MSDLGPAERFIAGAIGEPGNRTFYIYIETGGAPHWFLLEKGQVEALARQSLEAIDRSGLAVDDGAVKRLMSTDASIPWPTSPEDVRFRVAGMALRLEEAGSLISVILESSEDEPAPTEPTIFQVAPEQLRAMSLQALDDVHSGRPICPKCRLPEEPAGHRCPSSNGHHG
jgi:uncharacterized repeat protein (TIGR03847 family)